MRDIEELYPRVMEVAPACPEPVALRHLRDAAIDFCRRTRIWRTTESWGITVSEYEIVVVDQEAALFEITHARIDDSHLEAITIDQLDIERREWRDEEGQGKFITQSFPNTVRVVPKPAVETPAQTLTLELVLVPAIDAVRIPDELVTLYSKVIADGALGRVLLLPAPWGNAELGLAHRSEFERELGRWQHQIPKGQQKSKRRTKATFF